MRQPQHRNTKQFRPSGRQVEYLRAWLDPALPKSVLGICRRLGMPRRTVHRWLAEPSFVLWFDAEVKKQTAELWGPVLHKLATLALTGSIEHIKLFARRHGATHGSTGPTKVVNVIIGVPRSHPKK